MNESISISKPIGASEAPRVSRLLEWLSTVDHKQIGILYMITTMFFFVVGGLEALFIRIQLSKPDNNFVSPDTFNQLFTLHGTTMIFFVVMPLLIGFANYFVPLMIGATDMAFPRLNAFSYWVQPFAGILVYFSIIAGGAPEGGWFSYAPLSGTPFLSSPGINYWAIGLLIAGIGSVAASINMVATILCMRVEGMTMNRLPLFVWMTLINSILIIFAIPFLNSALVMTLADRLLQTHFFSAVGGVGLEGNAVLYQHLFWAFGHPEVYIMILPAFGMVSEMIPVFSRKAIFGYGFVAASTVAIAVLSFGVWAHHMFTMGLGKYADFTFGLVSMLIAIPTGVKIFNWMGTLHGGKIILNTAMKFSLAFIIEFLIGGLSGVTLAAVPIDWQVKNNYYLVAHFHYVLFGGTAFILLGVAYYWFPKISGRMLSEKLGSWNFWTMVLGFNMTFFIQHFLGLMGMTRRVSTYPDLPYWHLFNFISTVGAFIMGISALLLIVNILYSRKHGKIAGNNPWRAWTLEWATTSPPPPHNFDELPEINGARPLWDLAHPEFRDEPDADPANFKVHTPDKNMTSVLWFIASEIAFFFCLLITYYVYNYKLYSNQHNALNSLEIVPTIVFTIFLLSSSFTIHFSEKAFERKQFKKMKIWLIVTILFGMIFIAGQGHEYYGLYKEGILINSNLFATTFFTLTGFHGIHVCFGLIALLIVLFLALRGDVEKYSLPAIKVVGAYWHFVDWVWLAVFTLVYVYPYLPWVQTVKVAAVVSGVGH